MSNSILADIADGSSGALEASMERYGGLVASIARRYCPASADVEDAVQDIFLALWQAAPRFDATRARESTFVALIARRRMIDRFRRSAREREALARFAAETERETVAAFDPVDLGKAARAVESLRPEVREIIALSIRHGLTHREIAEKTGVALGTVKSHLRRGLERVRETLVGERR